jgi:hypothetical protein
MAKLAETERAAVGGPYLRKERATVDGQKVNHIAEKKVQLLGDHITERGEQLLVDYITEKKGQLLMNNITEKSAYFRKEKAAIGAQSKGKRKGGCTKDPF